MIDIRAIPNFLRMQKIQMHLAVVAKLVGQLNRSQVENHRNSIKISYGRPLPQRV